MHIIIGIITAIAGLVWALFRLQNSGVDLNAFNPFHWFRRRNWEKQLGVKPLHRLDKPMDVAAALVVGIIKLEGEISREQKAETIQLFEKEFNLASAQAAELFSSSSFLLNDSMDLTPEVRHIVAPCKSKFTPELRDLLLNMLRFAAELDSPPSELQLALLHAVSAELAPDEFDQGKWS